MSRERQRKDTTGMKANKTSFNKRQKIKTLLNKGHTIPEVCELTGCTYFQVYNVYRGRVKMSPHKRAKNPGTATPPPDDSGEFSETLDLKDVDLDEFKNPEDLVNLHLSLALGQLNRAKMPPAERIKILKEAVTLQERVKRLEIEAFLKNPKAELIVNIIKRLDAKLTDGQIIRIIEEEREKLKRL